MDIREATPQDLPAIVAIYNATVPGRMVTAELEPTTVEKRRPWFEDRDERHPIWVIEDGGEVAAWLSYEVWKERAAYQNTAEVSVYVDESYRRRGIGKMMLEAAISEAPKLGFKTLCAGIFGHNTPSIALFETFGFTKWAHYPKVAELDGIERDLVVLGLRVG